MNSTTDTVTQEWIKLFGTTTDLHDRLAGARSKIQSQLELHKLDIEACRDKPTPREEVQVKTDSNMNKINHLLSLCKAEVSITINYHKNIYISVEKYFSDLNYILPEPPEVDADIMAKMIELDTVINVTAYPNTPIGSYTLYHYDVDMAIDEMIRTIERDR